MQCAQELRGVAHKYSRRRRRRLQRRCEGADGAVELEVGNDAPPKELLSPNSSSRPVNTDNGFKKSDTVCKTLEGCIILSVRRAVWASARHYAPEARLHMQTTAASEQTPKTNSTTDSFIK